MKRVRIAVRPNQHDPDHLWTSIGHSCGVGLENVDREKRSSRISTSHLMAPSSSTRKCTAKPIAFTGTILEKFGKKMILHGI